MTTVSSTQKNHFKSFIVRHPLASMYIGTFILAWAYFVPRVLHSWGLFPVAMPEALALLAGWTPAIAATIVTGAIDGWEGVKQLFSRYLIWRVSVWWYVFVLVFFVPTILSAAGLHVLFGGEMPQIGAFNMQWWEVLLSFLVQVLLLMLLNGEEVAWRGFALPRLQARYNNIVVAALLVAIPETLLHAPGFFLKDDPFISSVGVIPFILFSVALSVIYAWTFFKGKGSVLLVALFHASQNAWGNLLTDSTARPFHITVVLLWVVAIALILFTKGRQSDPVETS
ncbi:MAG TPA: CPBP family intramembrane glutamic endopeptidase [Anaerolineales bacterium]|nr:CPBP family intramembrane glutamic endopeptidase [Anaerolineales bacterium]